MLMQTRYTEGDKHLLDVARALRESPHPDKFDMGDYVHACGAPACALGHYGVRKDLQDLMVLKHYSYPSITGNGFRAGESLNYRANGNAVGYDDDEILEHFEISCEDAWELFAGDGCGEAETPNEAADYIEDFVAKRVATRVAA